MEIDDETKTSDVLKEILRIQRGIIISMREINFRLNKLEVKQNG